MRSRVGVVRTHTLRSFAVMALGLAFLPLSTVLAPSAASATMTGVSFTSVVAGSAASDSCALSSTGDLYCWGSDVFGQLLDGKTTPRLTPLALNLSSVLGSSSIIGYATGGKGTICILTSDSRVFCWGYGGQGQLGDDVNDYGNTTTPVQVAFTGAQTGSLIQLSGTGANAFCALTSTSQIWCWGGNAAGTLGDGLLNNSAVPVQVDASGVLAGRSISSISVWENSACAVSTTGATYCWGAGNDGQLGNASSGNSNVPVIVSTLGAAGKIVTKVAPSTNHTCVLDSLGEVYCWGSNKYGTNGLGQPDGLTNPGSWHSTPQLVSALSGIAVASISSSGTESCAVTTLGHVYCWGAAPLGDGTSTTEALSPELIHSSSIATRTITQVSSSDYGTCAVDSEGSIYCWGQNQNGLVGNGDTMPQLLPVEIAISPSATAVNTVPTAPTAVKVSAATGSVLVSWSAPASNGGAPISSYHVTATPGGASCSTVTLGCTVTKLSPSTLYQFSVTAANSVGSGDVASSTSVYPFAPAKLGIVASSAVQSRGVAFTALVGGAKPGANVTVTLGAAKSACVANSSGQCTVTMVGLKVGPAFLAAKLGTQNAAFQVYVPSVVVAARVKHGTADTVRIYYAPPRSTITFVLSDGRTLVAHASASGSVSEPILMPKAGVVRLVVTAAATTLVPFYNITVY